MSTTRILVSESSKKTQYSQAVVGTTLYLPGQVRARLAPIVGVGPSQQPWQGNWPTHTPHVPAGDRYSNGVGQVPYDAHT